MELNEGLIPLATTVPSPSSSSFSSSLSSSSSSPHVVQTSDIEGLLHCCQDLQGRIIISVSHTRLAEFLGRRKADALRFRLFSVKEEEEYPVCLHEAHRKLRGGSKEWYSERGANLCPTNRSNEFGLEIQNRASWAVELESSEDSNKTFDSALEKLSPQEKSALSYWRANENSDVDVMLFVLRSRQIESVEKQIARLHVEAVILDKECTPGSVTNSWVWGRCHFKIFSNTRRNRNVITPRGKRPPRHEESSSKGKGAIDVPTSNPHHAGSSETSSFSSSSSPSSSHSGGKKRLRVIESAPSKQGEHKPLERSGGGLDKNLYFDPRLCLASDAYGDQSSPTLVAAASGTPIPLLPPETRATLLVQELELRLQHQLDQLLLQEKLLNDLRALMGSAALSTNSATWMMSAPSLSVSRGSAPVLPSAPQSRQGESWARCSSPQQEFQDSLQTKTQGLQPRTPFSVHALALLSTPPSASYARQQPVRRHSVAPPPSSPQMHWRQFLQAV